MGQGHMSNTCAKHDEARYRAGQKARRRAQRSAGRRRVGLQHNMGDDTLHEVGCLSRNRVIMQGSALHGIPRRRTRVRSARAHRSASHSAIIATPGSVTHRRIRGMEPGGRSGGAMWVLSHIPCHIGIFPVFLYLSIFPPSRGIVFVVGLNTRPLATTLPTQEPWLPSPIIETVYQTHATALCTLRGAVTCAR